MRPSTGPIRGARVRRGIAVAAALVHAGLIAWAWHAAAPAPAAAHASRTAMQWVRLLPAVSVPRAASPPGSITAATHVVKAPAVRAAPAARARSKGDAPARIPLPASEAVEAPPAVPVQEAVRGVAFAPPRIGGWGAAPLGWMKPPPGESPPVAATPAAYLAQMMQAQAAREAGRARIAGELQRTLADALADLADGACALDGEPEARLACDNDALAQILASREAALAGLLRAYRSMEPRAKGLAIAVVQGRTQVSWSIEGALR